MYVNGSDKMVRPRISRRLYAIANGALAAAMILGASLLSSSTTSQASSHREAPLISQDPSADNTDTYFFVSPTNPNNVVLVGSWIPMEGPEGAPNYFEWGNGVNYQLHIDNDGDAKADFTYELTSRVDVKTPTTFLYNVGPIGGDGTNWNRQQRITIKEIAKSGTETVIVDDKLAPPVNIGSKSTDNYATLNKNFIYEKAVDQGKITAYAGQVDDAFWVDLQIFDLLTLRGQAAPVGYSKGNNSPVDSVAGFNNHSIVIEVPISRLKGANDSVLGMWATASRPQTRVLNGVGGLGSLSNSGNQVQVSRLGMPLVNEVVFPYALKDAFNAISPDLDAVLYTGGDAVAELLQNSVENPEIGRLLCAFYAVPLPADANKDCNTERTTGGTAGGVRSGRGDIFDIFLRGMVLAKPFTINTKNGPVTLPAGFRVNRPNNPAFAAFDGVVPSEMIRLNTDIKGDLCSPKPSRLGVLGGDACGFPNGRRLFDDIVEIELVAVAGAAYQVLDGRDASFSFNPALVAILDDHIDFNDVRFRTQFPYMALAQSGQEHIHTNPISGTAAQSAAIARVASKSDDAEEKSNGKVSRTSDDLDLGEAGQLVGMRFTGVEIPKNATIVGAHIQFIAQESGSKATTLTLMGEATDDAAPFKSDDKNLSKRAKTSAKVNWTPEAWSRDNKYWSADVAPIVQEIVSRGAWTPGNDLVLFVNGTGERDAWAYDGEPGKAALLYIEYHMGGSVSASGVAADTMELPSGVWSSSIMEQGYTPSDSETITETVIPEDDDNNQPLAENQLFLPITLR